VAEEEPLVNGDALLEEKVEGVVFSKVKVEGEAEPEKRSVRAGEGDADPKDAVVELNLSVGVESRSVRVGTAGTMEELGVSEPEAVAEGKREGKRAALRDKEGEAVADKLILGLRVAREVPVAQDKTLGKALGKALGKVMGKALGKVLGEALGKAMGKLCAGLAVVE
jgi:hypothetical protein